VVEKKKKKGELHFARERRFTVPRSITQVQKGETEGGFHACLSFRKGRPFLSGEDQKSLKERSAALLFSKREGEPLLS